MSLKLTQILYKPKNTKSHVQVYFAALVWCQTGCVMPPCFICLYWKEHNKYGLRVLATFSINTHMLNHWESKV